MCRLESLNMFVMCVVSVPVYVKVSHLCSLFGGRRGGCRLEATCEREGIGKELLRRNIVDDVFFSLVFYCVKVVGV